MLLVKPPDRQYLLQIIEGLLQGRNQRREVISWQRAVQEQCGWDIPIGATGGYWYFYSLAYLEMLFPGTDSDLFIREQDLNEYRLDIMGQHDSWRRGEVRRIRSFELDIEATFWPLTVFASEVRHLEKRGIPSVRGTFERRQDLVEHSHFRFRDATYLVVQQYDDVMEQGMVLGTHRDPDLLEAFLTGSGLVG